MKPQVLSYSAVMALPRQRIECASDSDRLAKRKGGHALRAVGTQIGDIRVKCVMGREPETNEFGCMSFAQYVSQLDHVTPIGSASTGARQDAREEAVSRHRGERQSARWCSEHANLHRSCVVYLTLCVCPVRVDRHCKGYGFELNTRMQPQWRDSCAMRDVLSE